MKTRYSIVLIFLSIIFFLPVNAQEKSRGMGRGAEVFPYPFEHFTFIQPRFDRTDLPYGNYLNSYVVRAANTFPGNYHLRLELPISTTKTTDGDITGLADIKVRLLHSTALSGQWFLGYGFESTLPTAVDPALGSGKWQMRPELGALYFFGSPKNVKGSFMLGVDYRFDFAGQSDRDHISVLGIAPNIDYWGNKWYIGYYSTWTYDFIHNLWDIPLDVEAGYTFYPKLTFALEYIQPLLKERTYNYEYAAKIRYMF